MNADALFINDLIIRKNEKKSRSGEIIYKLISSFYYVYADQNIIVLADELQKNSELDALCVVDYDMNIKGIIIRKMFFDRLGKNFGRDIFKNRNVEEIMTMAGIFSDDESIFTITETVREDLLKDGNVYYILADAYNHYSGIVSTKNILIYLSELTKNDLSLAQNLQKRIVKEEEHLLTDKFEIIAMSRMLNEVGGDFYTIREYSEDNYIISICDVSGKGISASVLTSLLGGMFNAYDFKRGIKGFILALNNYIFKTFSLEKYLTGIIMSYSSVERKIVLCDLGHSYIYLFRKGKLSEVKSGDNPPIGIVEKINPKIYALYPEKHDLLVLFTDGLIEQEIKNQKVFSADDLENILIRHSGNSLIKIKDNINSELFHADFKIRQKDDITFILLKFL